MKAKHSFHNAPLCGQYLDEDTSVAPSSSSPSPMMKVVGALLDLLAWTPPCSS